MPAYTDDIYITQTIPEPRQQLHIWWETIFDMAYVELNKTQIIHS